LKVRQSSAFWDLKEALSESNLPFLVELFDPLLPLLFLARSSPPSPRAHARRSERKRP
jgi:hypothetical protein